MTSLIYTEGKLQFSRDIDSLIKRLNEGSLINIKLWTLQFSLKYGLGELALKRQLELYCKLGVLERFDEDNYKKCKTQNETEPTKETA